MARTSGNLLRGAEPGEPAATLPDTPVDGFVLRNTEVKRTKENGAPFYVFDVLSARGARVGIASYLAEPSSQAVTDYGHVCVTLDEERATPELLASLARPLIRLGHEASDALSPIRIVVPEDHPPSIEACTLLDPDGEPERVVVNGKPFLAYSYSTPRA
jgi:hypothetical protein